MRLLVVLFTTLFVANAWSAQVKSISGKKAVVDMQSDQFKVGDILKVTGSSGKTVAVIKVTKISGKMAEGPYRGKPKAGFKVALRPAKSDGKTRKAESKAQRAQLEEKKSEAAQASDSDPESDEDSSFQMSVGAMGGYNMTDMEATLPNSGDTVDLSGSGFSVKGLVDLHVFEWLSLRVLAGIEQLVVDGANDTECGGACEVEITYLTGDFWARYMIFNGSIAPWAGAGFSLLFPLSKDATAISESSITNSNLLSLGGGIDWKLSDSSYIPLQIEYNLYPSTDSVKTNAITFRGGFGMAF
jgi:hypothetical protein